MVNGAILIGPGPEDHDAQNAAVTELELEVEDAPRRVARASLAMDWEGR